MDDTNDLLFERPLPDQTGHIELVFGAVEREPAQVFDGDLDGVVSPPRASGIAGLVYRGTLAAKTGAVGLIVGGPVYNGNMLGRVNLPRASGLAEYDLNVHRGPRAEARGVWQRPKIVGRVLSSGFSRPARSSIFCAGDWARGGTAGGQVTTTYSHPPAVARHHSVAWQGAAAAGGQVTTQYAQPSRHDQRCGTAWQAAQPIRQSVGIMYAQPAAFYGWLTTDWQGGRSVSATISSGFSAAAPALVTWLETTWGRGRALSGPGVWVPPETPVTPPPPVAGPIDLLFVCDLLPCNIDLVFGGHCCGYRERPEIPVQTTYFMTNSVTLLRESDQRELPVMAASLSLDPGTWAWAVNIVTHVSARQYIGRNELLRLIVNGHHFVWIADPPSQDRTFGAARLIQIAGRSQHAELDIEATSGVLPDQITARQLAELALENTGYTLDWDLPDWLIPAGAYSWDNLTRINRIAAIVDSARGRLWGRPDQRQLVACSSYPIAPWDWGPTGAREIPTSVITQLSEQWVEHPEYNAALICGERAGYKGRVKRQGTAGELLAPSVVHQLMTGQEAILERALVEIASSGWERQVSVTMPLFADLPLYEPSQLIAGTGGESFLGMFRGLGIEAQLQNDALVVRQTLALECKS